MKYYRMIEPKLNAIIAQSNGQMVSGNVFNVKCQAWYPNYILHTYDGSQFNVMGVMQVLHEQTDSGPIFYLCTEINLNNLEAKDLFNIGSVFFVGSSGRIYNEQMEKSLLIRFEILRGLFIQKYRLYPGYPMFLTRKQNDFLQSLRED